MIDFYLLIVVVVAFTLMSIRVVPEDRRLVFYRLGRYQGVKGPGLVFTIPGVDKVIKIAKGDTGVMRSGNRAFFHDSELPVSPADASSTGQKVKVHGFRNQQILVMRAE
jgi:regulator of protease activity HflC (stomatin/prohibitin superfamily)